MFLFFLALRPDLDRENSKKTEILVNVSDCVSGPHWTKNVQLKSEHQVRQHQERGRGEVAVTSLPRAGFHKASESQPALETLLKDSSPLSPELLGCFQLDLFEVRRPICQ